MVSNDAPAPVMGDAATEAVAPGTSIKISDAAGTTRPSETHSVFQQNAEAVRTVVDGICWQWVRSGAIAAVTPG